MKNLFLVLFSLLCLGSVKATPEKKTDFFQAQRTFTVYGINVQGNYEVTFKFFPQKKSIYGPAPKAIEFQNKLLIVNEIFEVDFKRSAHYIPTHLKMC